VLSNLNEIFRKTIERIKQLLRPLLQFAEIFVLDPVNYWKLRTMQVWIKAGVTSFLYPYNVPGLSLAIAYKGRLVFSEGYGLANKTTKELVAPEHLFRIGSLSKPITSVAVFRLIDAGMVNLNDPVFGANGILGITYGTPPPNSDIDKITVQHLLEHTSGWSNSPTDIVFDPNHLNEDQAELISWMVANRSLAYKPPGSTYEYLNFGYLVLGRVIEQVSGMPYAEYVRQRVLAPCGISDMHIAGDTLAARRDNEVVYYSQDTYDPYKIRVARMDASVGWIASPTDLVRFLAHVDGFPSPPDILSSPSISTMVTPTTAALPGGIPSRYAKGWDTHPSGNYFHSGDIQGSAALFVRTSDEYCFAIAVNSRYGDNNPLDDEFRIKEFRAKLDQLMSSIVGGDKRRWPHGEPL
jgi:CubicO group peptidase (beta-lactamase class C family)